MAKAMNKPVVMLTPSRKNALKIARLPALLLLTLTLFAGNGYAQSRIDTSVSVRHFTLEHGLAQTQVEAILEDSEGVMWFGTRHGLSRYDSQKFKSFYPKASDSALLQSGHVLSLCDDRQGNIWIATSGGVSVINKTTLKFKNYDAPINSAKNRRLSEFQEIIRSSDGGIWLLSDEYLTRFSVEDSTFKLCPLPFELDSIKAKPRVRLVEDNDGKVWGLVKGELFWLNPRTGVVTPLSEFPEKYRGLEKLEINSMHLAQDGTPYFCTETGLFRFPPNAETFEKIELPPPPIAQEELTIQGVKTDHLGGIWCTFNQGIGYKSPQREEWLFCADIYANGKSLGKLRPRRAHFSANGLVWFTTTSGIAVWNYIPSAFKTVNHKCNGDTYFPNLQVASMYTDNEEDLWIATWGGGVNRLHLPTLQNTNYSTVQQGNRYIPNDKITGLRRDVDGQLICATPAGLLVYDAGADRWEDYFLQKRKPQYTEELHNVGIYNMLAESDGSLWIATMEGLACYSHITEELKWVEGLKGKTVLALCSDGVKSLYLGCFDGLYEYIPALNELQRVPLHPNNNNQEASNELIVSLKMDRDQTLWIGSASGLFKKEKGGQEVTACISHPQYGPTTIYAIEVDRHGKVWAARQAGLICLNPRDLTFRVYGQADGIGVTEFNNGASFQSPNGRIYFGGATGIIHFDPLAPISHRKDFRVVITECLGNGIAEGESLLLNQKREVTLLPGYNSITISLSLLAYAEPHLYRYQYRIPSFMDKWENIHSENSVTFSALPEGRHTFEFRAALEHGPWIAGEPITIVVKKTFWASRMAKGLYVFLGFTLIMAFIFSLSMSNARVQRALHREGLVGEELREQQKLLSEKNKNISDSISYAQRIIASIMPTRKDLASYCPESFLIFMPKDIVSGDLYWVYQEGPFIYLAVVDCTGHGVPGALMATMGSQFLKDSIMDRQERNPGKILEYLNMRILESHSSTGYQTVLNDGMDPSLCVINTETKTIAYAGAFQQLFHFREGNLNVHKGDAIFTGSTPNATYTTHHFSYQPEDTLYLFSDGYFDQFGGPDGRKYRFSRFQKLIGSVQNLTLKEQEEQLLRSLTTWQGDYPQVDDITVLGVRCRFSARG